MITVEFGCLNLAFIRKIGPPAQGTWWKMVISKNYSAKRHDFFFFTAMRKFGPE